MTNQTYHTLFNEILHNTLSNIPECEAGAYIDLECGQLLGTYSDKDYSYDERIIPLITNAVNELFNSQHVSSISQLLKEQEKLDNNQEYFNEIIINGVNHTYLCMRTQFNSRHVVTFVYRNTVNQGMMLRESKQFLQSIEEVAKQTETPCCAHHTTQSTKKPFHIHHPSSIVELELPPTHDKPKNLFSTLPSNFATVTRSNHGSQPTPYDMLDETYRPNNKYRGENDIISALDKFLGR